MAQPEKTFRIGSCSASVFVNTSGDKTDDKQRSFRNVSLQRRYRDDGKWKSSNSFTLGDLPAAIAVLNMALDYVASQEASQDS